jgi:hypothetical protein
MPLGQTQVPFPDSSFPGTSGHSQEASGRIINAYIEPLGPAAPAPAIFRRAPGMLNFGTTTQVGFRGATEVNGTLFCAFNNRMVTLSGAGGAAVDMGALTGSAKGFFARNNSAPTPQKVFCDVDGNYAKFDLPTTITMNYDADLPAPNSVCQLDGYFVYTISDGRVFASDFQDTNVDPLSFANAESKPDGLLRAVPWAGQLYLFGPFTTEVWQNAGTTPFPFQRVGVVIPRGLAGPYCVTGFEDNFSHNLVWVADDNTVVMLNGYTPQKISSPDLDGLIEDVANKRDLEFSSFISRGHAFLILSSLTWSWVFDLNTQRWAERDSYLQSRSRIIGGTYAFGRWLCGDTVTGNIHEITDAVHTEPPRSQPISGAVRSPVRNDLFTKVMLNFDEQPDGSTTFIDSNAGGGAHVWTAFIGAQIDTAIKKYGSGAALFGGAGSCIHTPDSVDFTIGTSDFTVDFFFFLKTPKRTQNGLAGQMDSATGLNVNRAWYVLRNNTVEGDGIGFAVFVGGTEFKVNGITKYNSTTNIGLHHCAAVRAGDTLLLFIDGILEGSVALPPGASINDSSSVMTVGGFEDTFFSVFWVGTIDQFRFSKTARWTSNFTPPLADPVRLTVLDAATIGPKVIVSGVVGTTEANNIWTTSLINKTHIELVGSDFGNTYVSGGIISDAFELPFRWRLESGAVENFPVGARVGRADFEFVTGVGVTQANYQEKIINVFDAGASFAHQIRVVIANTARHHNGDAVKIVGVAGTIEANGTWPATVINSTTLQLTGSLFANAYTSGGTATLLSPLEPMETDPVVEISWTDDGGQTYYAPIIRKLGRQEQQRQLVSLISCTGRSSWNGRRWRLDISDPVYVGFMAAYQQISAKVSDIG